jgi:hypothetical protein
MTPESFEAQMREIDEGAEFDPEMRHVQADELMMKLLMSLGYGKGVAVFNNMPKWYA